MNEPRARSDAVAALRSRLRAGRAAIPRVGDGPAPLTGAQEGLWYASQLAPSDTANHRPSAALLTGPVDVAALGAALRAVIARHEPLRTSYPLVDGAPCQVVHAPDAVPVAHAAETAPAPLAITDAPPVRVELTASDDGVFVAVAAHHLAFDGMSERILWRDLATAYDAIVTTGEPNLPPTPTRFRDFAVWQRARSADAIGRGALERWLERLDGAPPLPRTDWAVGEPGVATVDVDHVVADGLRALARSLDTTLFGVLLSALHDTLARRLGADDVVVGVPIAGRTHPDTEDLVGCFTNVLPLRMRPSGDVSFRDAVTAVAAELRVALTDGDVSLPDVARAVRARTHSRDELYAITFQLLRDPRAPRSLTGGVTLHPIDVTPAPTALDVRADEHDDGTVSIVLRSGDRDGFPGPVVTSLGADLEDAIRTAIVDPGRRTGRRRPLPDAERRMLVERWNDTTRPYPRDATIPDLLASAVDARRDAIAVTDHGERLTYGELWDRAGAFAEDLRAAGVGAGDAVGVAVPRCIANVVAVVGVLRAGAVYVPVDADAPPARTDALLDDLGARLVVTRRGHRPSALTVDARACRGGARLPGPVSGPLSVAYVMSTSGSTGTPKYVAVPHRAMIRLAYDREFVPLEPDDVMAFASNPAFDAATFEIWTALLNGISLAVLARDETIVPERLAAAIRDERVTVSFLTTSVFHAAALRDPAMFASMRTLAFGGEACDASIVHSVVCAGPPWRLVNAYGPTEATSLSSWYAVTRDDEARPYVPIGRPVANTTLYVVDDALEPVPVGVPGELLIGGDALALGYVGDPDLTAQRFVPDHLGDGDRLYRTGDVVRRRDDGEIEFLRRFDGQVKLRGMRVELGEIEAALRGVPGVDGAAARVHDAPNGPVLAAYYVAAPGAAVEPRALRDGLARVLPRYMLPTTYTRLDAIPVNANGKVDRDALPAPRDRDRVTSVDGPARTPVDARVRAMTAIWSEQLGVAVGPDDDFFDLGGHSLVAVHLLARIEDRFGVTLPLAAVMDAPTPRGLVARLDEAPDGATVDVELAAGPGAPMILLPAGGGETFFYRPLAQRLGRRVVALVPPGLDGVTPPLRSVASIAEWAAARVQATVPSGPYLVGGFSSGAVAAYETARRLAAVGRAPALVVMIDPRLPPRGARRVAEAAWLVARRERREAVRRLAFPAVAWNRERRWSRSGRLDVRASHARLETAARLAVRRYEPGPYAGAVLVVSASEHDAPARALDWRDLAPSTRTHLVAGTHLGPTSILAESRVEEVAAAVRNSGVDRPE